MAPPNELDVEKLVIELLQKQGYTHLSSEDTRAERQNLSDVVLNGRLKAAIDHLNQTLPAEVKEHALRQVIALPNQSLIDGNETFYQMLTEGVAEEYQNNGEPVGAKVQLIDFDNPLNNDLAVCDQFTVAANNRIKRPDVVIFVNGLPLVVIELKNPTDEKATVHKAFTQLQNYKNDIPNLFCYNGILVASDGIEAKAGSLTSGWDRFMTWKTVDGVKEDPATTPQIETIIKGMLHPDVLLDLVKHFTVFASSQVFGKEKKIAAYHQYHAVKEAVKSTIRASYKNLEPWVEENPGLYKLPDVKNQPKGDRKAGVVWHTQGSGKSLSMVFYAGLLVVEPQMKNPTLVVITDRNDLDEQLFDTFADSRQLLRQKPKQADSQADMKDLLQSAGGGIVFTTIQKFYPDGTNENFEMLSQRENIVVIVDEAHRSQYGFAAKTTIKDEQVYTKYGFAKYLRDALPNASFVGFTGTPIEKEDASTPAVFGNYIDIYDIQQSVEDKATVPIYYESRLVNVHLKEEEKEKLDAEVESITENEDSKVTERAKAKWTQLEAIVGHRDRLKTIAQDILNHFEERRAVIDGKGMIVAMSRRIAAELYDEIIKLRPEWDDPDNSKGKIKVIMTSSSSDPASWQRHNTSKQTRKKIGERFKNPKDSLQLVIVRDMWLTGFDAPCLHTMYVDKSMQGHNLMQAIARVNRVYKDKDGGLIVDYIGIASYLKKALASYTRSGGQGAPVLDQEDAIAAMHEKYEIVVQMFDGCDYQRYFSADTSEKLVIILEAQEHVLSLQEGKARFTKQVGLLVKAFALSVPSPAAMEIKQAVGFFQAIKSRLIKFENSGNGKSSVELETAIRQIVDKAVVVDGVTDIFDAAGIKKPNISILSNAFLEEIRGMKHKNIAMELLKKILNDEIKTRAKKNVVQGKKLSVMLDATIKKYQNKLLTAPQVIEELIKLAKEIKASDKRGEILGLTDHEVAFYDALEMNGSAKEVLGDDTLRDLARLLVEKVRTNTTIDWTIKESVQAKLRVIVKKILRQFGYPPDKQKLATENILKQAELLADEWSSGSL